MSKTNWSIDKIISRLKTIKSRKSYWEYISILRKRPSEDVFIKCKELIDSDEFINKKIGIDVLAQLGLPPRKFLKQTLKIYFDLLKTENNPEVLMSVLYGISHNKENLSESRIKILCSFTKNDNKLNKEGLVAALIGIENELAIETIIKLSSDKISHIRNWATFGLGTLLTIDNEKLRTALWNRVNDKHQETKLEAIAGLANRKDERINDIIIRELKSGEMGPLLLDSVLEMKNKAFLPIMNQHLTSIQNDQSISEKWKTDYKNCVNRLTEILKENEITTRKNK